MNKSFILLDKNNNLKKNASIIVKFNFEGKDYLVYSIEENEQNSQIFVSNVILNSEGKYFIDNVMLEEKNKLNNVVYNIVILTPTEAQKGVSFDTLSNNLLDKFAVKLSLDIPDLGIQEYFSSSSVAITSKILVDAAVKFYVDNLKKEEPVIVPTWTAPVEATAPTPMNNVDIQPVVSSTIPVQESVIVPNNSVSIQESNVVSDLNLQSVPVNETVVSNSNIVESNVENIVNSTNVVPPSEVINDSIPATVVGPVSSNSSVVPNPQVEKLAVVSDPSLGIGVSQPNIGKTKKAGYANTKYIVIGTVCLLLAVAIVITAYILISNMQ